MTHIKVIHRVKNRKCGRSRISEGKLGCKVQTSDHRRTKAALHALH